MTSANWKMATEWSVPLTFALCPVRGWHREPLCPSRSVWAALLWAVEQWGCNLISAGSLGWPACEREHEVVGTWWWWWGQTPPWGLLTEAPLSHTLEPLTVQHRWIRTRNPVGGLSDHDVCLNNPMLSVISGVFSSGTSKINGTKEGRCQISVVGLWQHP